MWQDDSSVECGEMIAVYAGDTSVECGEEDESLNSLETLPELRHRVLGHVLYKTDEVLSYLYAAI